MNVNEKYPHKYHYFYKITNLLNGCFYYGIHSTNNLDDGYMGSGYVLNRAYQKYGVENFRKEILKFFDNREMLSEYERQIVTLELVKERKCYNVTLGGDYCNWYNMVSCKNKDGEIFFISKDDPLYNTTYFPIWIGQHHKLSTKEKLSSKRKSYYDNDNIFTWMHRKSVKKRVKYKNIEKQKLNGWELGEGENTHRITYDKVHKDGILKFVRSENTYKYLENGWKLGTISGLRYKHTGKELKERSILNNEKIQKHLTELNIIKKEQLNKDINVIKECLSKIDISKFGWKSNLIKMSNMSRNKLNRLLKTYFSEIYNIKSNQTGTKNSQYGTCWVWSPEGNHVKIKKEQLNEYLNNGYVKKH